MKQLQVQIDLEKTKPNFCQSCKCEEFELYYYIRTVPAIYSPTARPELLYVPAYRCTNCKTPFGKQEKKPEIIR